MKKINIRDPKVLQTLTPKWSHYIPELDDQGAIRTPSVKQHAFLLLDNYREIFYGGAAGGGKTDALMMAALQYFDMPGYRCLILRRTFPMLNAADSILHRMHEWLRPTPAKWRAKHNRYESPEGGTIQFGYLAHDKDVYQYDGPAYHMIIFDELTQFTEWQYRFMFGRNRKAKGDAIPLRIRAASNPGALWVKDRFVLEKKNKDRLFIQALLEDNPHIDQEEYLRSLENLDPVTYAQRRYGDWEADMEGTFFKRSWLDETIESYDPRDYDLCRFWDLAGTKNGGDFTAGVLVGRHKTFKNFAVLDVVRGQWSPGTCDQIIKGTTVLDGKRVRSRMEQEPGASGKHTAAHYTKLLAGYDFKAVAKTVNKMTMWRPFASQMEGGQVVVLRGSWTPTFLDELFAVPFAKNDDQTDAAAGAFAELAENNPAWGMTGLGSSN